MVGDLIVKYVVNNYILIVTLTGLWLSSYMNINLSKYTIKLVRQCIIIIFTLSVIEYIDQVLATLETLNRWRLLVAALAYTINPLMIIQAIRIICGIRKYVLLLIPAFVNVIVSFSVFFTDIAYYYTEDNQFHRGPIGIVPYIVSLFYILLFLVLVMRHFKRNTIQENIVIIFMAVNGFCAIILHFLFNIQPIFKLLFTVDIVFYFLFLHIQYAKLDNLTGLLNRQAFFSDLGKYRDFITGIITIDMNELKWINDKKGHLAGDEALKAVSKCFLDSVSSGNRVYRVGGDEFQILCLRQEEQGIEGDVKKIREALKQTEYSCAIGMACVSTLPEINTQEGHGDSEGRKMRSRITDRLLVHADEQMYEDKRLIKQEILKNGGVLHSRKEDRISG